jgi:hypothetical protein
MSARGPFLPIDEVRFDGKFRRELTLSFVEIGPTETLALATNAERLRGDHALKRKTTVVLDYGNCPRSSSKARLVLGGTAIAL